MQGPTNAFTKCLQHCLRMQGSMDVVTTDGFCSICCCKQNNVGIVYTMASNLKKTSHMEIGQVSFHNEKAIKKVKVERKVNEILNRLEKTRTEVEKPDLEGEKEVSHCQGQTWGQNVQGFEMISGYPSTCRRSWAEAIWSMLEPMGKVFGDYKGSAP
eukprot:816202-Pelagomonas_calceolata.AAC.2